MAVYGGFDPGLSCGLAFIEREGQHLSVLALEAVVTEPSDPLAARLKRIWMTLSHLLRTHRPLALCIEDQRQAQVAQAKRGEFTCDTSRVNQVVGLAKGCCLAYGIPVIEVSPARAKIALLGPRCGKAGKQAVRERVSLMTGRSRVSEHAADAVGLALAGEQEFRRAAFSRAREAS